VPLLPAEVAALLGLAASAAAGATVAVPAVAPAAVVGASMGAVTAGFAAPLVRPLVADGGDATGAIGVVENGAAGSAGVSTAVVPVPLAALGAVAVEVGGALGACAPPEAFVVSVADGAPGHSGHAVDSGVGPAGRTPAVVVDEPAPEVAPVATGAPRIAPVPLVCARAWAPHDPNAAISSHPLGFMGSSGACDVPRDGSSGHLMCM